jgi:hypothetical protein
VKIFKSDNGTEFVNSDLSGYFEELGIIHQTTIPYCPESNGSVEREMRTLKDTARAMMHHESVPQFLWAEAIACSVYIHNRVLNKQSKHITAYERIIGEKPNLNHLRVFGCKAFAQIPKEKRSVWDAKSKRYMLVGYDSFSRKYRLYDPVNKAIFLARNVSFVENEFGNDGARAEEARPTITLTWTDSSDNSEDEDSTEHQEPKQPNNDGCSPNKDGKEKQKKSVNFADDYVLQVETRDGTKTLIPFEGMKKIDSPRILRDRSTLKIPEKYQANLLQAVMEPRTYAEAIACEQKHEWEAAIKDELKSLIDNKTWDIVPRPPHSKVLDGRWVFKVKRNSDGSLDRFKARLVIRGYRQQYGIDYNDTFASVCRYESVRLLLALAAACNLSIKQFDVKTAFLNGILEEEIFMEQPEGMDNGNKDEVCLLRKCLYGLKQAPRMWNKRFAGFLTGLGFLPSTSDPSVFIATNYPHPVYLLLYVDDGLVISRNDQLLSRILQQIQGKFEIKVTPLTQFLGI